MSKYQFQESDIYYAGTDVPINALGLKDPEVLHEIGEQLLSQSFLVFAQSLGPETQFDEALFKQLHQVTFKSLYQWAGIYRSLDMEK